MADAFVQLKWTWLDQVAADREVSAAAFRLAFIIASRFLNRETGDAWPAHSTLGEAINVSSSKGVKHLLEQLEGRGHLKVTVARGRGHTNRYRPILKREAAPAAEATPPTETQPAFELTADVPTEQAPAGRRVVSTVRDDFEEWWVQYPRKVAKQAAQKAYERARRGGATKEELVAGVMRYGEERAHEDPRYTKHPATWLNGACHADEPVPRPRPGGETILPDGSLIRDEGRLRNDGRTERPRSWTEIALGGLKQ